MSRPLRIEYKNAIYHVMNRGRNHAPIFHEHINFSQFLLCVEEATRQFGLEVLAYCLMDNHYHLLVRTPRGNLSRCMRHINGVYTQRYNKFFNTDGTLFRGRYKSILVDTSSYLLQVSRYIHRNPLETQQPLVKSLRDYTYSSYPAYIGAIDRPAWLNTEFVLSALNAESDFKAYETFVKENQGDVLNGFYSKKKTPAILGKDEFISLIKNQRAFNTTEISQPISILPNNDAIVSLIAQYFNVCPNQIINSGQRNKVNIPRRFAMYFCKQLTGEKLETLAHYFNVTHYSTISQSIKRLLEDAKNNKHLQDTLAVLSQDLTL